MTSHFHYTLPAAILGMLSLLVPQSLGSLALAGIIPPFVVTQPTTIIDQTRTAAAAMMGSTIIAVEDDGFIVGADITVGGQAREVAGTGEGFLTLTAPLSSDVPAGSLVVHKPAFAQLTVASQLTVRADAVFPSFAVSVLGDLYVTSSGFLDAVQAPAGPATPGSAFNVAGRVIVEGTVRAAPALTLRGQAGAALFGSATGSKLTFGGGGGPASIEGSVAALESLFINTGSSVTITTGAVRNLTIFQTGAVAIGSLTAQGAIGIKGIAGGVTTGPLTAGEFIAIGGGLSPLLRIAGDVTTGPLRADNADGFVVIDGVTGNVNTPSISAAQGFVVIKAVNGVVTTGPLTAGGFIAVGPMQGSVTVGSLNAPGFIGIEGVGGDVTTGALNADGSEGFIIIGRRARMRGNVTVGPLSANGVDGFILIEGLDRNLSLDTVNTTDLSIKDVRGMPLLNGPIIAGGKLQIVEIPGPLVIEVPVSASGLEGPLQPFQGDSTIGANFEAGSIEINAEGAIEARRTIRLVADESAVLTGPVHSLEGGVLLEGAAVLTQGDMSAPEGPICAAASEINVMPGASLSALNTLWVSNATIPFGGQLVGTNPDMSTHFFRLPSVSALILYNGATIEPEPTIIVESVSTIAKGCRCRPEVGLVSPDCPPVDLTIAEDEQGRPKVRLAQVVFDPDINEPRDGVIDLVSEKPAVALVTVKAEGGDPGDSTLVTVQLEAFGQVAATSLPLGEIIGAGPDGKEVELYFTPTGVGQSEIDLAVDPGDDVTESDETNNAALPKPSVDVKATSSLNVLYVGVDDPARRTGVVCPAGTCYALPAPGALSETRARSDLFIEATFPVATHSSSFADPPYVGHPNNTCLGQCLGGSAPGQPCSDPVDCPASTCTCSTDLEITGGMLEDAANLGTLAVRSNSTRALGVVSRSYWNYHRQGETLGITYLSVPQAAMITETTWSVAAHEIGHTYGLRRSAEEYRCLGSGPDCTRIGTRIGRSGEGFWVVGRQKVESVCFMGSGDKCLDLLDHPDICNAPGPQGLESLKFWVDAGDYAELFQQLRTSAADPEVLAVSVIIDRDGSVEARPWYLIPNGTPSQSIQGNIIVRALDAAGATLASVGVQADFVVHVEPFGPRSTSRIPLVVAVPYPPSATVVEIVRDGQVLVQTSPTAKILHDAVDAVPDVGFVKNSARLRKALHSKIGEIEEKLAAGAISQALDKLVRDLRPHIVAWLVDGYLKTDPLQLEKAEVLGVVDGMIERVGGLLG